MVRGRSRFPYRPPASSRSRHPSTGPPAKPGGAEVDRSMLSQAAQRTPDEPPRLCITAAHPALPQVRLDIGDQRRVRQLPVDVGRDVPAHPAV